MQKIELPQHALTAHENPSFRILSDAVGMEITGLDARNLDADAFDAVYSAWLRHGFLLFRDQELSDDDLIGFSRRFGDLDYAPVNENGRDAVPGKPEVYVISNVLGGDGRPIGSLGAGEAVWHTDMSYLPKPPTASALYAKEVPPEGGDTWFLGMVAATRGLPADLLSRVEQRSIKHDGTYNSGGYLRKGVRADDNPMTSEGAMHPILCVHPETGEQCVFLGRRRNAWVVGLEREESEALLDELWSHVVQERFVFRHQWRVGDFVIWDNRSTMHRRDAFNQAHRRILHRTQITGKARPAGVRN